MHMFKSVRLITAVAAFALAIGNAHANDEYDWGGEFGHYHQEPNGDWDCPFALSPRPGVTFL
jgi:hypothetical protein